MRGFSRVFWKGKIHHIESQRLQSGRIHPAQGHARSHRVILGALLYKGFHHPAVHVDGLASDEFRLIRCEKSDHVGDIFRVTVVP